MKPGDWIADVTYERNQATVTYEMVGTLVSRRPRDGMPFRSAFPTLQQR